MLFTDKQTNKQTNQRYQKHNLLCQGGNKQSYRKKIAPQPQHVFMIFGILYICTLHLTSKIYCVEVFYVYLSQLFMKKCKISLFSYIAKLRDIIT